MTIQIQIDNLGERMDKGFSEIKDLLNRYDERLRGMETREAGCSPIVQSRIDAAWKRIDAHSLEIKALNDAFVQLSKSAAFLESVAKWLLGIVTAVIIAVVVGIATGKISITFN